jgi:hypothetical protein
MDKDICTMNITGGVKGDGLSFRRVHCSVEGRVTLLRYIVPEEMEIARGDNKTRLKSLYRAMITQGPYFATLPADERRP